MPSQWLSLWNVAGPIGMICGALITGYLGDIIGRRRMLASATVTSVIAVALCFVADLPAEISGRRGFFFFANFISGLSVGAIVSTAQIYMSETMPQQLRGPVLAIFPIFQLVSQIIGSIVVQIQMEKEGRMAYRLWFASQWPFSIVPIILSFFLPESPALLLRQGQVPKRVLPITNSRLPSVIQARRRASKSYS